ncbi:MAG: protein translocase subunit SecF [Candidatus Kerfeldbacteria bacterium]
MYRIIHTTKYWSTLSIIGIAATVVLWFVWGLNLGIDFTGGTSMELRFPDIESRPSVENITTTVTDLGVSDMRIQTAGESNLILKMQHIENKTRQQILDAYKDQDVVEENYTSIGPTLGEELKRKAVIALLLVLFAIIGYISYAFRKVSNGPVPSWVFGLGAIVALAHDILLVVGAFILLGHFMDVQVDTLFVTALLTILGFSVHDTIVVYDRIREGLKDRAKKSFKEIINESINTTLVRSINTSFSTLLVLLALYLFGGASIQWFVLALILGILTGTYSSIFIASPLLLVGQRLLKR